MIAFSSVVSMSSMRFPRNDGVPAAHCDMYTARTLSGVFTCTAVGTSSATTAAVVEAIRVNATEGERALEPTSAASAIAPPNAAPKTALLYFFFVFIRMRKSVVSLKRIGVGKMRICVGASLCPCTPPERNTERNDKNAEYYEKN